MPLLTVTRLLTSLASWIIAGLAVYFIWSWWDGYWLRSDDGVVHYRENWRLYTAIALSAWTFLGGFVIAQLLAKPGHAPRFSHDEAASRRLRLPNGGEIYYEVDGPPEAATIILTHGQGVDSTFWARARPALAPEFRIVTWDLPGLGKSHAPGGLTLTGAVQALAALIREDSKQRVLLVGHSFGGMAIQELARAEPALFQRNVAGVALLNTTYTNPLRTMIFSPLAQALQKPVLEPMAHLTQWLLPLVWLSSWQSFLSGWAHVANRVQFADRVQRPDLNQVTLTGVRNSPGAIERGNLAMFHWRGMDAATLTAPTLVIGGDKDIVTKLEASRHIAGAAPNARLEIVAGANHMGPLEFSGVYNEFLVSFARQVFTASPATTMTANAKASLA